MLYIYKQMPDYNSQHYQEQYAQARKSARVALLTKLQRQNLELQIALDLLQEPEIKGLIENNKKLQEQYDVKVNKSYFIWLTIRFQQNVPHQQCFKLSKEWLQRQRYIKGFEQCIECTGITTKMDGKFNVSTYDGIHTHILFTKTKSQGCEKNKLIKSIYSNLKDIVSTPEMIHIDHKPYSALPNLREYMNNKKTDQKQEAVDSTTILQQKFPEYSHAHEGLKLDL
eukprot:SAG11_NODE_4159_length_2032_cov_5.648215_2_plen_226_part_00